MANSIVEPAPASRYTRADNEKPRKQIIIIRPNAGYGLEEQYRMNEQAGNHAALEVIDLSWDEAAYDEAASGEVYVGGWREVDCSCSWLIVVDVEGDGV